MKTISLLTCLSITLFAAFVACGDQIEAGTAPTISNLTYNPTQATIGEATTYTGTLDFSDPDGDLAQVAVSILQPDGAALAVPPVDVQGASGIGAGTVGWAFIMVAAQVGDHTFDVWTTDEAGNASNRLTGTIDVSQ